MTEQRVAAVEQMVAELRDASLQLRGALDEQRANAQQQATAAAAAAAAAAARPALREVVDTRLRGKPENFNG
eukprot:8277434-Pyramimonas_sp.AAC.1